MINDDDILSQTVLDNIIARVWKHEAAHSRRVSWRYVSATNSVQLFIDEFTCIEDVPIADLQK